MACREPPAAVTASGRFGRQCRSFAQSSSNVAPALYVNGGTRGGTTSTSSPIVIVHYRGLAVTCSDKADSKNDVMSIDQHGNMTLSGALTSSTPPLVVTRTTTGSSVIAFTPWQSQPMIEDFGTARLVDGSAFVHKSTRRLAGR